MAIRLWTGNERLRLSLFLIDTSFSKGEIEGTRTRAGCRGRCKAMRGRAGGERESKRATRDRESACKEETDSPKGQENRIFDFDGFKTNCGNSWPVAYKYCQYYSSACSSSASVSSSASISSSSSSTPPPAARPFRVCIRHRRTARRSSRSTVAHSSSSSTPTQTDADRRTEWKSSGSVPRVS